MGEAFQHGSILLSVRSEEDLVGAENARDAVNGYVAVAQYVQIVVPKLVFNEESHNRSHRAQELSCVRHCVDGQISYDVRLLVVLSHLVSRGREER